MKFKPRKSLGQNFLIDKNILNLIVEVSNIRNDDIVLEVGPGTGNLTKNILTKKPKKLFVIEKDNNLSALLKIKFKKKIKVINDDVLNLAEEKLSKDNMIFIGNLPYNMSTQILVKWIKKKNLNKICKRLILMFQKEVADRIIAQENTKQYGRLSILSSWRFNIKKVKDISPNSFYPIPKIKSTILILEPKGKIFKFNNPANLEFITKIFFNKRRKMINKPLNILFKNSKKISNKLNLNIKNRPENLSPQIYFEICKEYEKSRT